MKRVAKLSFGQGQLMLWILIGSLLAVGGMFVLFRITSAQHMPALREVPHIEWMPAILSGQLQSNDERYVLADVLDPSLMSLPSAHGFSREVWQRRLEATQRNLGWNEEPAYLAATPPEALHSLLEPAPLDAAALSAAEKTPAQSEESDEQATEPPAIVNASVFRVLGSLEERGVMRAPDLPVLAGPVPARPVQVRVGVGADGLVRYASLDRSSGNETMDAQAVLLARQFRFQAELSESSTALTWGIVRFLWATRAVAATNGESAAAQP